MSGSAVKAVMSGARSSRVWQPARPSATELVRHWTAVTSAVPADVTAAPGGAPGGGADVRGDAADRKAVGPAPDPSRCDLRGTAARGGEAGRDERRPGRPRRCSSAITSSTMVVKAASRSCTSSYRYRPSGRRPARTPGSGLGVRGRLALVASTSCDAPLRILPRELVGPGSDPAPGVLVVEVSASAAAPRMVDGHHFARTGTTTQQLGASAVKRLVLARATTSTDGLTTAASHVGASSELRYGPRWLENHINLEERMVTRRMRVIGAISAAAGLILLIPTPAVATPSVGVTGTVLATATIGGTDYVLREITIQPGGTTGWHWHDGTLFGYVKSGTLTHEMADCRTVESFTAGRGLREDSGADKVHRGVNIGTTPVVLDVLYVDPHGAPLSENALDPGCPALG